MRRRLHAVLAVASAAWAPVARAKDVSVCVTGALVAPTKPDGTAWDFGDVPPGLVDDVRRALDGTSPYEAVTALLRQAGDLDAAPDAQGTWEISEDAEHTPIRAELRHDDDTFAPDWALDCRPVVVALTRDTRLRVTLDDDDLLFGDDAIGSVELGSKDLKRALTSGGILAVDTRARGTGILFVRVAVFPAR